MSSLHEGCRVSYVGDGSDGRTLGDRGQLLVRSGSRGHVRWSDNAVSEHYLEDLAPSAGQPRTAAATAGDGLEDSLEVGSLTMTGARGIYDTEGGAGVLNAMATTGALVGFSEIARDTQTFVAARIRQDPHFRQVLSQLDEDEAEDLFRLASLTLLRDAFGDSDE